ncbi:MAG TPA: glycosyltransferase family 4 protein [Devosiaceae bacterium]|jgi:glycosyltransferase involved in cell wall biosynthesis|nr:glycosyltransferase family 4 protein [Devosiaceae bacterium]
MAIDMNVGAAGSSFRGRRPRIIYLVTEDWYFWSHRLPVARAARDAGFDVAVATRVDAHGERIAAEGFRVHAINWRRRGAGLADLQAIWQIAALYRRERPDIVHHVALKPVLYGAAAARMSGTPAMVSAITGLGHAFVDESPGTRGIRTGVTATLRVLLRRPQDVVLLQNPDDVELVVSSGIAPRSRTRLIPGSGVDTEFFRPLPEPTGPVVCALVSRMLSSKGIETAVAAVRLLRSRGHDICLHLAGDPDPANPASISVAQLRAWDTEHGITWFGHVEDVREVWRSAHIGLLPSLREGLPKSLLEAAACGRPLVAADVPGSREIVRQGLTGLLVPPGDVAAWAEALLALANNPGLRRRYGLAARQLVERELSATRVGEQTLAIYGELLQGIAPGNKAWRD